MASDDLTAAAERARLLWPGPIGETAAAWLLAEVRCHEAVPEVADAAERLIDSISGEPGSTTASLTISTLGAATQFAAAILAAPVPEVDRQALADAIYDVIHEHVCAVPMDGHSSAWKVDGIDYAADALLARGLRLPEGGDDGTRG